MFDFFPSGDKARKRYVIHLKLPHKILGCGQVRPVSSNGTMKSVVPPIGFAGISLHKALKTFANSGGSDVRPTSGDP